MVPAEACDDAVIGSDDGVGDFPFCLLQLENLLLNRIPGDEAICKDMA